MGWLSGVGPWLIAAGGLSGLAAILLVPGQLRKLRSDSELTGSEAASKLNAISLAMLEPARQEISRLTRTCDSMSKKLEKANGQIGELTEKVEQLGRRVTFLTEENDFLRAQIGS